MKYLKTLIPAVMILTLLIPVVPSFQASEALASTVPTFSIVSVVKDTSVTIKTSNFPAGKTWKVRMGLFGTRGVGGSVVGNTYSASGGSFEATYTIPASLKGLKQIAIRMDADSGGWFAYNWFYNNPTGSSATSTPGPSPTPGYSGIPTFSIKAVVNDTSVTIKTSNFPAGKTWTVRMGPFGTRGVGGTVVGSTYSASGGSFEATYTVPASLKGSHQIAIRMDANTGGWFAYNWFYNNSTGSSATSTPGPTPTPGYSGIPTFSIKAVVKDTSVTIKTSTFPAGKTWTVRMGPMGTRGVGGTVVGSTYSASGGSFEVTYTVPASLKGSHQIAIRLEADTGGWFAYNWFYNNTYP